MVRFGILMVLFGSSVATCHVGSCDYYQCIEKSFQCGTNEGYPIAYGFKYCSRYEQHLNEFTDQGKTWVTETKICLQNALNDYITKTTSKDCSALKKAAMDSHVQCYVGGTVSVCEIWRDWARIFKIVSSAFGDAFMSTIKQSFFTGLDCAVAYANYIKSAVFRFEMPSLSFFDRRRATGSVVNLQEIENVRDRIASYLQVELDDVLIDVSHFEPEMVFVDGTNNPISSEFYQTFTTYDVEINVLSEAITDAAMIALGSDDVINLKSVFNTLSSSRRDSNNEIGYLGAVLCQGACNHLDVIGAFASGTQSQPSTKLSSSTIAGIVVGSVFGTIVICLLITIAVLRYNKLKIVQSMERNHENDWFDNSTEHLLEAESQIEENE